MFGLVFWWKKVLFFQKMFVCCLLVKKYVFRFRKHPKNKHFLI
ncbi:Hypothetical Protein SLY_0090 [Strawberry lethal yellows phytoplasma (CPA) str. NZSb11]|uniref:Uncharacterized protein n=1 Tax=Strawberry lethal yellows phytoplasma (CPA) str. NZSb11 TaxID=980422 RepID=R4RNI7_PHYAS|nr:Hypothetical Protein SLY_0090 [Strawberry lethal yellows phytoplasma (CPA) str. NZSb11]